MLFIILFVFLALILIIVSYFLFSSYQKKLEVRLFESFKAISFDVLQKSSSTLVDQAKASISSMHSGMQETAKAELDGRKKEIEHLLSPIKEVMGKIEKSSVELEKKREVAYEGLKGQINQLIESERMLMLQTQELSKALRCPNVRGTWGQVHLRRVVEMAGLLNHCDFYEQKTIETENKLLLRPDLIIQLPGERQIIVDAKTPLNAYLDASEEKLEGPYLDKLKEHAKNIRRHLKELSRKEYYKQFERSVEYVILFLPAEAFFSSALQADPTLIETGAFQNVLIATPTTLIAILRAVALSWRQEALSKNAEEISILGKELYERIATISDHWSKVGKSLSQSMEAYNQATSSLESRVLASARKFSMLGAATTKEVKEVAFLEKLPKSLLSQEMNALSIEESLSK